MTPKQKPARTRKASRNKTWRKTVKKTGPRTERDRKKWRDNILKHPAFSHLDPANGNQTNRTPE